ncbi:murein transglycosylase A [Pelagovum pacificum]|uniref:peptidoglycan lytic exotransglycosylase n=1 Tax=Pelagovum pacificum TaxID=2588711 RepID=A0A5C5GH96_9RHOB|nr:MltA domain-containing protein [Pelagovum pacificum]QQA42769.1 MltA domain-containing protein [Pelagovum pacificum]TNY34083.1 murein transglycosylase [Pelagovum pacificum]
MRAGQGLAFALALLSSGAMAQTTHTILEFDELQGWPDDDHDAALTVFRNTCMDFDTQDWSVLCDLAEEATDGRSFFEMFFTPILIEDGDPMLFTGYFEPELRGSLSPSERFRYPVYGVPPELGEDPWLSRREIEETGILADRDLEIAWVDDPVDLFFLQIQGSGRIRLPDGRFIRVGYGGANKRPYTSVGTELIRRGVFEEHEVSAPVIRSWVQNNPILGQELLWANESYVFFREVSEVPADRGPLGAMNRSITPMRSIAVDPSIVPLGAPVWIEKDGNEPMQRLMVAQDTGAAIKGAQRADIFFGFGDRAGARAGTVKDGGRMVVLVPIQRAYAMLPEVLE